MFTGVSVRRQQSQLLCDCSSSSHVATDGSSRGRPHGRANTGRANQPDQSGSEVRPFRKYDKTNTATTTARMKKDQRIGYDGHRQLFRLVYRLSLLPSIRSIVLPTFKTMHNGCLYFWFSKSYDRTMADLHEDWRDLEFDDRNRATGCAYFNEFVRSR